jgi:adenine phosphoribosyltransferase
MTLPQYADLIRNIPDFPIPGVQFKDITPLLADPGAFEAVVNDLATLYSREHIDIIAGVEARGYIFSAPLAYKLGAGLVPIRKPGKLPAATVEIEYSLEYGTNRLQMHEDAFKPGARVLLIDDLLATGGTMAAAAALVEQVGGEVVGLGFVIELSFLNGRDLLGSYPVQSLIQY